MDQTKLQTKNNGAVILPGVNFKFPRWMECTWRRVPCNKKSCAICGKVNRHMAEHMEHDEHVHDVGVEFEDITHSLRHALTMIKRDAKRLGIDISNIDTIKEPPRPSSFPLYRKANAWNKGVFELYEAAHDEGALWIFTEAAADLSWYAELIASKTYRQLCNRWHLDQGDQYGDVDYAYTKYVLGECSTILKRSLDELVRLPSEHKGELASVCSSFLKFETTISEI